MYVSLKLHFKGTMDYFKYGGNSNSLSLDAFINRKDRHFFERIYNTHKEDSKRFLLSSFVSLKRNPSDLYVHEILEDEHYEKSWRRFQRVESVLSLTFREDLTKLVRMAGGDLKKAIRCDGGMSLVLKNMFNGTMNIESYVILNKIVDVNKVYVKEYPYDPRVNILNSVCLGYDPFVQVDLNMVKQIIKDVVSMES